MNARVRSRLRGRTGGDEGVGLILVIGVSAFTFLLAAVAVSFALQGVTQSRQRTAFEKSLASAEAGIDATFGKLQESFTTYGADYPVPATTTALEATPACSAVPVAFPASGEGAGGIFSSESAERAWATTQLEALVAVPGCVIQADDGEYVVLKPPSGTNLKYGRVYALAAMPSFAAAERTRLIKREYIFMPYRPAYAILTNGDLEVSASTTVTTADPADALLAAVHANGTLSGVGNPTVTGPLSSTGMSGNLGALPVARTPEEIIPYTSARAFYAQAVAVNGGIVPSDWYDLCPNGDVKQFTPVVGGAVPTGGPCQAAAPLDNLAGGGQFRGWEFDATSHTWTATRYVTSGTYYVHEGDVEVGTGNATIPRLTIIAAAQDPQDCAAKQYGNITWNHYEIEATAFGGQWMFAEHDLITGPNFTAGEITGPTSGMFTAGDQVQMETSSTGAVGAVVAAGQCPLTPTQDLVTSSRIQNPTVYYDPESPAAFTSVITTSLWLDYSGS